MSNIESRPGVLDSSMVFSSWVIGFLIGLKENDGMGERMDPKFCLDTIETLDSEGVAEHPKVQEIIRRFARKRSVFHRLVDLMEGADEKREGGEVRRLLRLAELTRLKGSSAVIDEALTILEEKYPRPRLIPEKPYDPPRVSIRQINQTDMDPPHIHLAPRLRLLPEDDPRRRASLVVFQAVVRLMQVVGLTEDERVQFDATRAAVEQTLGVNTKKLTWRNRIREDLLQEEGIPIEVCIDFLDRLFATKDAKVNRETLRSFRETLLENSTLYLELPGRLSPNRLAARQQEEAFFRSTGDMEKDWQEAAIVLQRRREFLVFPHEYRVGIDDVFPKEGSEAFVSLYPRYQSFIRMMRQTAHQKPWFEKMTVVHRNDRRSLFFHGVKDFGLTNAVQLLVQYLYQDAFRMRRVYFYRRKRQVEVELERDSRTHGPWPSWTRRQAT